MLRGDDRGAYPEFYEGRGPFQPAGQRNFASKTIRQTARMGPVEAIAFQPPAFRAAPSCREQDRRKRIFRVMVSADR